ncbi:MAG: methylated-DNA--protein-cysteine methyltransferase [Nitrospinaceae bacterium]|nr:MAG: methylated-DNA--protein-cysteine methyltransferase [Nitrospinaceae bacterium]
MAKRKLKSSLSNPIYYTTLKTKTPLGLIGIAGSEKGLLKIVFKLAHESQFKSDLIDSYSNKCQKNPTFFDAVAEQLNLYFAGELKKFTCKLDLSQGTPFQQKVWRKLTTIPYGKTRSYRTLAEAIGHPRAFRATGNANGKNPLPLIIPCHRVIRENGGLGGYSCGLPIKRFLLDLESV